MFINITNNNIKGGHKLCLPILSSALVIPVGAAVAAIAAAAIAAATVFWAPTPAVAGVAAAVGAATSAVRRLTL